MELYSSNEKRKAMATLFMYDAHQGLSYHKKLALVKFIRTYGKLLQKNTNLLDAIEFALKEKPSFGGFILTIEHENRILAALIITKTGMTGIMPEHLLVVEAFYPSLIETRIPEHLFQKAHQFAKGNIAKIVREENNERIMIKPLINTPNYAVSA